MRSADMIWFFMGPALVGMVVMVICGAIAKSWLEKHMGYQASRAAAFFLGPLLTSFGPVKHYAEARRARNESTTLATVFWIATAFWGLGFAGFFVWIALNIR
jgi:hypothetical protein